MIVGQIRNLGEVVRKIEAMAQAGGEANVSGRRVIAETIATDVKASRPGAGVPIDQGPLRTSLRVEGPDGGGTVSLVAGGAAVQYALRQHETLEYKHTVGEARYWTRGFERWARGGNVDTALREMMDAVVERGKDAL